MKKNWGVNLGLLSISTLLSINLVSAGPVDGLRQLLEGTGSVITVLIQFIADTIFRINSFDEFLFAKLLFFVIIFLVTYEVIQKNSLISTNKKINKIIATTISILAIRYMPDNEFVNGILIPYTTLGTALTTLLPFAVYFLFVFNSIKGQIFRRVAWVIYLTIFLGIWTMRADEIGDTIGLIYGIAAIAIAASIVFDRQISKIWGLREINRFLTGADQKRITDLQAEYIRLEPLEDTDRSGNPTHAGRRKQRIRDLLKKLGAREPI